MFNLCYQIQNAIELEWYYSAVYYCQAKSESLVFTVSFFAKQSCKKCKALGKSIFCTQRAQMFFGLLSKLCLSSSLRGVFLAPVYDCCISTWSTELSIVDACLCFRGQEFRILPKIWEWGIARHHLFQGKNCRHIVCVCNFFLLDLGRKTLCVIVH